MAVPDGLPSRVLRVLAMLLLVRPFLLIVMGVNVRNRRRLPLHGPAVVVGNHNSHLDTAVLLSLFPLSLLHRLRPVAAADYFLANRLVAWFSLNLVHIIPIVRQPSSAGGDVLAGCTAALGNGDILLLFPEGTRGEPEVMAKLKSGVARLAERFPAMPVVPVFMAGLGRSLPRGAWFPVPLFCDVFVGPPLQSGGDREDFMTRLHHEFSLLQDKARDQGVLDKLI